MPRPVPDRPAAGCSAVLRQVPGRPSAVAELVHVLLIAAAVSVAVGCRRPRGPAHVAVARHTAGRGPRHAPRSPQVWRGPLSRSQRRGPRSNGRRTSACTCMACPPRTSPPSSASSSPLPGQPSRRTGPGCWACQRSR